MAKLVVRNFAVSIDGYAAGPNQDLDNPLGVGGFRLLEWAAATRTFRSQYGEDNKQAAKESASDTADRPADQEVNGVAQDTPQRGGRQQLDDDIDDSFMAHSDDGIGATIQGRNMFGPIRGPWPNEDWKGWWGDEPPYHNEVFVLTHHPRASLPMLGGTTFHFVTDGITSALDRALDAAGGQDVKIAGGASTIRQYLSAGLIDELDLAIVPVLLGRGERLFNRLDRAIDGTIDADDDAFDGFECISHISSPAVLHVRLARK